MSPEIKVETEHKCETYQSAKEIEAKLAERYDAARITGNYHLPACEGLDDTMGICKNKTDGVRQSLRAMLKTGNEFFSIVDIQGESFNGTVLTRHIANSRAEFAGFLDKNKPLAIGRTDLPTLDKSVSRDHFFIAQGMDGSIGIIDNKSTNGTEIFTPTEENNYTNDNNLAHEKESKDPVYDFRNWSVKSSSVNDLLINHNQ